jgi:hypothetical protein
MYRDIETLNHCIIIGSNFSLRFLYFFFCKVCHATNQEAVINVRFDFIIVIIVPTRSRKFQFHPIPFK